MGERCTGVGAIVRFGDVTGNSPSGNDGLPVEVLVCGESRFVIVRESETSVGTRIGGVVGRRKRPGERARDNSAIIAHPRPPQPNSVAFNLSINPRRQTSNGRSDDLFRKPAGNDAFPDKEEEPTPTKPKTGFAFLDTLSAAADAEQQEDDEERDVEEEMLDLMDIDRELDVMNAGRGRVRKKVIFEQ